jgi:hypothetical protein
MLRFRAGRFEFGPLYDLLSVPGTALGDDNIGEDGIDSTTTTLSGITSAPITLTLENAPTGETGAFTTMNSLFGDANTNLSIDFGFRTPPLGPNSLRETNTLAALPTPDSAPDSSPDSEPPVDADATYAQWAARRQLGAFANPDQDPDSDGIPNLLEYALGMNPHSGLNQRPVIRLEFDTSTGLTAIFDRPVQGLEDVRYYLDVAPSLSDAWQTVHHPSHRVTISRDGLESVRLSGFPSLANPDLTLVRLRVSLDADRNGAEESAAFSQPVAWMRRTFPVGKQTLSIPLLQPSILSTRVTSIAGSTLTLAASDIESAFSSHQKCYLEVATGRSVGHRFEINESASSGNSLMVHLNDPLTTTTSLPATLIGARIHIRPHWTLAQALPPTALSPGLTPTTGDGALYFDTASGDFSTHWVQTAETPVWRSASGLASSTTLLPPGHGLLFAARNQPVTLTWSGLVRDHAFLHSFLPGTQLVASGFPAPASPASMKFTAYPAGSDATGDCLNLWLGDSQPGASAYQSLLFQTPGTWFFQPDDSQQDQSQTLLLSPGQALFFKRDATPLSLLQDPP